MHILEIQSSARHAHSVSRTLSKRLISKLRSNADLSVTTRDLAAGIPFVSNDWIEQSPIALKTSEELISEVERAEAIVIGLPLYNFGVPACFKAWFDQVAIAGRTFKYVNGWPKGLLDDRPTWVIFASHGVPTASDVDFATPWLRTALNMIGIRDIHIISADQHLVNKDQIRYAEAKIDQIG